MVRKIISFLLLFVCALPLLPGKDNSGHLIYGLPSEPDLLLNRSSFAIGYSFKYRQPLWVCYILSASQLKMPKMRRRNRFTADPDIRLNPVKPAEYRKTGYDRGHLAPAADMNYAELPMKHSFYMSNMSPQLPGFNRGIWKRLELQIRQWAKREEKLCIITGPLFFSGQPQRIGRMIPVPDAFFKIILDLTPPHKMVAFVIPNNTTKKRLKSFAVTVDHVENLTGFDFFSGFPGENELENRNQIKLW